MSKKNRPTGWHAGRAVRVAREDDGMSLEQLAVRLQGQTDESWYPAKISRIERGDQKMTVDDLVLFARVQSRDWAWYLGGPSMARSGGIEANPGQLRSKRWAWRIAYSKGFRPSFGL